MTDRNCEEKVEKACSDRSQSVRVVERADANADERAYRLSA